MIIRSLAHASRALIFTLATLTVVAPDGICSSESGFDARSRHIRFRYYDSLPVAATFDSAGYAGLEQDVTKMWDAMARGLGVAVACQKAVEADERLSALLEAKPVWLMLYRGMALQTNEFEGRESASLGDSLLPVFRGASGESLASMYTVRLGSVSNPKDALAIVERLQSLASLREEGDGRGPDSTRTFTWWHFDANTGSFDLPFLFTLPPGASGNRRYLVLSGLFYEKEDATDWADLLKREYRSKGEVTTVRVTGSVLRNAFPPL